MDEKTLFIIIITYLGIMSLILFLMMGIDKAKAKQGARRLSEKSLFTVAALGGGIGGVLGMKVFHHKTLHTSFKLGMPALTVLNFGIAFLIMWLNQRSERLFNRLLRFNVFYCAPNRAKQAVGIVQFYLHLSAAFVYLKHAPVKLT